MPEEIHVQF